MKTTTFTHVYSKDGRELSITATGSDDKTGNSKATFDANDRLAKLDLGKGDDQDSAEFKLFIRNNDGQILRRLHDDGGRDATTAPRNPRDHSSCTPTAIRSGKPGPRPTAAPRPCSTAGTTA